MAGAGSCGAEHRGRAPDAAVRLSRDPGRRARDGGQRSLRPDEVAQHAEWTPEQLLLRRCAYWTHLAGQPATTNTERGKYSSRWRRKLPTTVRSCIASFHRTGYSRVVWRCDSLSCFRGRQRLESSASGRCSGGLQGCANEVHNFAQQAEVGQTEDLWLWPRLSKSRCDGRIYAAILLLQRCLLLRRRYSRGIG